MEIQSPWPNALRLATWACVPGCFRHVLQSNVVPHEKDQETRKFRFLRWELSHREQRAAWLSSCPFSKPRNARVKARSQLQSVFRFPIERFLFCFEVPSRVQQRLQLGKRCSQTASRNRVHLCGMRSHCGNCATLYQVLRRLHRGWHARTCALNPPDQNERIGDAVASNHDRVAVVLRLWE